MSGKYFRRRTVVILLVVDGDMLTVISLIADRKNLQTIMQVGEIFKITLLLMLS